VAIVFIGDEISGDVRKEVEAVSVLACAEYVSYFMLTYDFLKSISSQAFSIT